jgi:UMF1 family MFS transporter
MDRAGNDHGAARVPRMNAAAGSRAQGGWALFQWARDFGGSIIVVFIFAPYFVNEVVGDPVRGQALWGHLNAAAGLCIGLLGPVLGAIADAMGRRKPWLAVFVMIMAVTSVALWWTLPGGKGLGIGLSALALVAYLMAYNFSDIFHSSMLPSLVVSARVGRLSGLGVALAQVSCVVGMAILLYGFMLPGQVHWRFIPARPLFGIDPAHFENSRIVGPISAAWLIVFSLPLFLFTPDTARISAVSLRAAVGRAGARLLHTAKRLKDYRNVSTFLVARMFFNDGQVAVQIFGSVYAASVFHWNALALTCYGILLSIVSIAGALAGGWLADRIGARRAIMIGIGCASVGLLVAISITPHTILFLAVPAHPIAGLAIFRTLPELVYLFVYVFTASCVIAVWGASRAMMARIAPSNAMSEFFGLYALSGTLTAFLGPELVASVTSLLHSQRAGMASLLVLLGLGLVGLARVRETRAPDVAAG